MLTISDLSSTFLGRRSHSRYRLRFLRAYVRGLRNDDRRRRILRAWPRTALDDLWLLLVVRRSSTIFHFFTKSSLAPSVTAQSPFGLGTPMVGSTNLERLTSLEEDLSISPPALPVSHTLWSSVNVYVMARNTYTSLTTSPLSSLAPS